MKILQLYGAAVQNELQEYAAKIQDAATRFVRCCSCMKRRALRCVVIVAVVAAWSDARCDVAVAVVVAIVIVVVVSVALV